MSVRLNTTSLLAWVVVYASAPLQKSAAFVTTVPDGDYMHGLDKDAARAIDVVWKCMHLPRIVLDCCDTTPAAVKRFQTIDVPHHIAIAPVQVLREHSALLARSLGSARVGAIICADELVTEVRETDLARDSLHGVLCFSELDEARVHSLWRVTARDIGTSAIRPLGLPLTPLDALAPERLSLLFFANQFGPCDKRIDSHVDLERGELIIQRMALARYALAAAKAQSSNVPIAQLGGWLENELASERHKPRFHVAVVAPGISPAVKQMRARAPASARFGTVASIDDERRACALLATHRAVARGGLGLQLLDVPAEAFRLLRDLERTMEANTLRPHKIKKKLARIGSLLDAQLDDHQRAALKCSKSVTIFSDFPWGLTTLRGDTSPICAAVPTSYRTLSPITGCLQLEFMPPRPRYLGSGFSVLVVECLAARDPVRKISELSWRMQIDQLRRDTNGAIECRYEVVKSVADMRALLKSNRVNVLVISAHGQYHPLGRAAGIVMESGPVLELDVELPPVVLFSACHVAPRGAGAVSVADIAFRSGAVAVLGTLFPIRADHNALFMTRLFTNICASMQRDSKLNNLAEVTQQVLALNAVIDILNGSARTMQWALRRGPNGRPPPLVDFMDERSVGRLLPGHTYEQTEAVLLEIARDHGHSTEQMLRQYLSSTGYVPESLFYVLLGRPEQIIIQPHPGFEPAYA